MPILGKPADVGRLPCIVGLSGFFLDRPACRREERGVHGRPALAAWPER
ncbi:MAG: hypothetical protein OZSIB_0200 [Candidatus Ozemobacter sibiricus]|uniref:Uncharacterized protein n=1 Tax=Candidatus Ozemobacter sibiricus TaxID=2268124 RepID=A0A367ZNJ9_9BACT|nr:MAG: hypothetical protein OZSIB_0200 [Candidatus Ozemobacter sibiricus]